MFAPTADFAPDFSKADGLIAAVVQKGADRFIQFPIILHNQNLKHGITSVNRSDLLYSIAAKC